MVYKNQLEIEVMKIPNSYINRNLQLVLGFIQRDNYASAKNNLRVTESIISQIGIKLTPENEEVKRIIYDKISQYELNL